MRALANGFDEYRHSILVTLRLILRNFISKEDITKFNNCDIFRKLFEWVGLIKLGYYNMFGFNIFDD